MSNCQPTPEVKRIIRAMAKAKLEEGFTDAHDIVDSIHAAIGEHTPLWKNEIADIVSGFGEKRQATKTELQERLTQLRRDLKQAYHPKEKNAPKAPDERRQKEIKKQIARIDAQLKSGDFSKAPPKPKPEYNEETKRLQSELDHARADADRAERKIAYQSESRLYRAVTLLTTVMRASILAGVSVFEHLAGASFWRAVSTVAEDVAGGVLETAFPPLRRLADKALLEGGGAMGRAHWEGLKRVFTPETLKMMRDKLVKGRSDRQLMYGKHYESNYPLLDMIGRSHDVVKTPLEQQAYGRALFRVNSNLRRQLARQGKSPVEIDRAMVTDSSIAFQEGYAYEASQAAKLQGKNAIVDRYNQLLREADRSGDIGALFAAVARAESPIVKIPLNMASEIFSYTAGSLKGASKYRVATRKGRELTPEDADYIMRNIKKQTVGAGLFALGYFGAQYFGGLWRSGKQQPNPDVEIGGMKVGDVEVDKHWMHSPALGIPQMGATMFWAMEEDRERAEKKGEENNELLNALDGFGQASMAVILDVPLFELPKDFQMIGEGGGRKFLGTKARQFIPAEVQAYARRQDVDDEGEPIKRKPASFLDELKMGVPGYREEVPEAAKK